MLMRARARTFLRHSYVVALVTVGCSTTLHRPTAGEHYRGAAATATQLDTGLRDGRLVFDIEVKHALEDGSFDATLTITEAKLIDNGTRHDDESLVGKQLNVGFDSTGRLVSVSLDGIGESDAQMVSRVIGALQATGPVSPVDLRTLRSDRPRQATIPSIDGVNIVAILRNRGSFRSNGHETGIIDIIAEQGVEIALDQSQTAHGRLVANGTTRVALDDLLISETRIANNLEYNANGEPATDKAPVMQRSETYVRIVPPNAIADFSAFADNAGLFGCSERVSALSSQIQAAPPPSATSDTSVPQVPGDIVQYGQEIGPRIVLGSESTYIVDMAGVRGPPLDRDQLGQALAQALPGTERAVVYVDADQALNARQVLDVASTINEMQQALEVQIDARLMVGARTVKLPASVSYARLRDEAVALEGAAPLARQALLPQLMRQELGRTCPAGYRASAESFAPGTSLVTMRKAMPGLVATCGCQGLDMQYIEGWVSLFDAAVLGIGWIPLPGQTQNGRALRLSKRASLSDLVGQLEQQGVTRNEYAGVRVVFGAERGEPVDRDPKPEPRRPKRRRPID
jgi:hypothetical protein